MNAPEFEAAPTCSPRDDDLTSFTEAQLERAKYRLKVIKPIIEAGRPFQPMVLRQAEVYKKSCAVIYLWISHFEGGGSVLTALCDARQGRRRSRLDPDLLTCIRNSHAKHHSKRACVVEMSIDVEIFCRGANLRSPHINTIRNYKKQFDKAIGEKKVLESQGRTKSAERRFGSHQGAYEDAKYPLDIVQVDHTLIDLILVDETYRLPIGRAYLTIALDAASRYVLGFYLSQDPAGTLSTGICLLHAMFPKDSWLKERQISNNWFHGVPRALHFDNGKEFWSQGLTRACEQHDIPILHRPLKAPRFGGEVERVIKTINDELHRHPSSTQSSVASLEGHKPEKFAVMTLFEAECLLAEFITGQYHQKMHRGILCSPMSAWRRGVLGSDDLGRGVRTLLMDYERVRLDFLPVRMATIQNRGITVDHLVYVGDILSSRIGAKDPVTNRSKRWVLRQDPRHINQVYFYDDETRQYHTLRLRNPHRPAESLWTWRAHIRLLRESGEAEIDEDSIFRSILRTRQIEEDATRRTRANRPRKKQLLANERARHHERSRKGLPVSAPCFTEEHFAKATGFAGTVLSTDLASYMDP